MVTVKWTNLALDDMDSIAEYISNDSYRYAKLMIARLFTAADILETFPKAGRTVPEFANELIREIIEGKYRIVYRIVNEKRIDILTVHHSSCLLENSPLYNDLI
ncbi:MAG: type II toxin-antitoxin system RelE/ParE family toxin [Ignavibacteriae bacterium]|nr:type II toxin-antitoxin system RelE/ParE family toxin [Ignavibacteriota bacterium]